MSLTGKTIFITGASGGIGGETALFFSRGGANIVANYKSSPNRTEETVRLVVEHGCEALAIKVDGSQPIEVKSMVMEAHARFERIDVLVSCAAKWPPPAFDFDEPDWDLWMRMANVNLLGKIVCNHFAAPRLRETNENIVNIVMDWVAGGIGYTLTTKTAGTSLTGGLARQLATHKGERVSPGAIDTWGMTNDERVYWEEITLLKRAGLPKDVAGAIVFLAS